jgi:hypothetical protein
VATMTFKANKSGAHDDGENDGSLGCFLLDLKNVVFQLRP